MNDATPRTLDEMQRRATRYEVAAVHPDGRSVVVGFTARKTAAGLTALLRSRADEFIAMIGADADAVVGRRRYGGSAALAFGSWTVRFTGCTERDVAVAEREAERLTSRGWNRGAGRAR